jgi:hypothetical protein
MDNDLLERELSPKGNRDGLQRHIIELYNNVIVSKLVDLVNHLT